MARLPYADLGPLQGHPLIERIVSTRGSMTHVYRMLLHSPVLTEGWYPFVTAVRTQLKLSGALRELVILRVGQLNGADYEVQKHTPVALAEGLTQAQVDTLADWKNSSHFDARERAVLALIDGMTVNIQVPEATIADLREFLDNQEVVELVVTVGAYNMVSRVLAALDIHTTDALPES